MLVEARRGAGVTGPAVSLLTWVLGSKLRSSGREASALNSEPLSPLQPRFKILHPSLDLPIFKMGGAHGSPRLLIEFLMLSRGDCQYQGPSESLVVGVLTLLLFWCQVPL